VKYFFETNVLSDFARDEQAVMARLRQEAPPQLAVSGSSFAWVDSDSRIGIALKLRILAVRRGLPD
jgi:hypothetical protein